MLDLSHLRLSNAAGWVKTSEDVAPLLRMPITDITLGSVTVEEREGNPEPTFWTAPDGSYALNSRGLPCRGIRYYEEHGFAIADTVHKAGKRLTVSIVSTTSPSDWEQLALCVRSFADCVELNLSCPNKWTDGENEPVFAEDPKAVRSILETVAGIVLTHSARVSVKLPPYNRAHDNHVLDKVLATIIESEVVSEVVSCNTVGGCATNGVLSMPLAGMSGSKIHPWAVAQMRILNERLPPHILRTGVGGINDYTSAKAFTDAGATGLQVGTHFFNRFPQGHIFSEILQGYADEVA